MYRKEVIQVNTQKNTHTDTHSHTCCYCPSSGSSYCAACKRTFLETSANIFLKNKAKANLTESLWWKKFGENWTLGCLSFFLLFQGKKSFSNQSKKRNEITFLKKNWAKNKEAEKRAKKHSHFWRKNILLLIWFFNKVKSSIYFFQ